MVETLENGNVMIDDETIAYLVDKLASMDGLERHAARQKLEGIGRPAVPFLLGALQSPNADARWESAKALGVIADPSAAPTLVSSLMDKKPGVRWLAATALINLGRDSLVPLLQALEDTSGSLWFLDGAHHVLHSLIRDGVADEAIPVLEALENLVPAVEAPVAAYHVLRVLDERRDTSVEPAAELR